ncbi:HAMP domain-containing histidine kinase [bacterium]|nr:HAMP domain-containing histidine kinase [bacterium]
MTNNQKKSNHLRTIIFEKSNKEYSKQTINGLFRSIIEPLIETNGEKALVFVRLKKSLELKTAVKRLTFSEAKIYSFSEVITEEKVGNVEKEEIWGNCEFLLVLSPRYSVALMWDYETSQNEGMSEVCLLYNTKSILDIAKAICSNSKVDFSEFLKKFQPDRRENTELNSSIGKLAGLVDDLNRELIINSLSQAEYTESEKNLENYEMANENIRFICHEIKNHLSIINLYSSITEKRFEKLTLDDETSGSVEGAISNIKKSSETISALLNDLKCFAKPVLEQIDASRVIESAVKLTKARAEEKNSEIIFEDKEELFVLADEMKLQNIIINLIYNSLDAVKEKGRVEISLSRQGNYAQILVQDNGEGIEDNIISKIFDINFTTKEHGNGLGLAICKTLTKEQKGELNLLMTGKKGTTFELLLPLSE